jgi:hypothetical protein
VAWRNTSCWLSAPAVREATLARLTGEYGWTFWWGGVPADGRRSADAVVADGSGTARRPLVVSIGMLAGVWLDRFSIIVAGVERDYLPSMWRSYTPSGRNR